MASREGADRVVGLSLDSKYRGTFPGATALEPSLRVCTAWEVADSRSPKKLALLPRMYDDITIANFGDVSVIAMEGCS